ncbi:MAG: S1 RNA-binding domain-containing protein [Spirochaetia bacterium]
MDGFLHVDDISWTKKYRNPGEVLKEGEEYEVIVTDIDPQNHNIRLGIKQLSEDPWSSLKKAYPEHSIIEGEITNITDFGIFVRVQGGIEGLINKSNLANPKEMNFEEAVKNYSVGDHVTAVITEINPGRQKLSLSVRELEKKQRRAELQKYIHDDDESTFTLGDMLMDSESEEGDSE